MQVRRGGVHFAPETMPFVPNIKCFSSGDCWLSGQSGTGVTTDGGSSWNVSFYGSKLHSFIDILCDSRMNVSWQVRFLTS